MDIIDIIKECAESLEARARLGLPAEEAAVCLVVPKGWRPPPGFPRGSMVQVRPDGARICYYPALRLSAWLVAYMDGRIGGGVPPTGEGTERDRKAGEAGRGIDARSALPRPRSPDAVRVTYAAPATAERRPRSAGRSHTRRQAPS